MNDDTRSALSDAVRYWEKMRVVYNIGLLLIVAGHFIYNMPRSVDVINVDFILMFIVLAVLANVFYSAAYIVDVFLQLTDLAAVWRKKRWILFTIGFIFAAIITRFVSMDIFVPA